MGNFGADLALDEVEMGHDAVVHEAPAAKMERVSIVLRDGRLAAGRADVGEKREGGGMCADGEEVWISQRLPHDLVHGGPRAFAVSVLLANGTVPGHAQPIRIVDFVPQRNLLLCSFSIFSRLVVE